MSTEAPASGYAGGGALRLLAALLAVTACAGTNVDPARVEPESYQGGLRIDPESLRFEDTVVGCARSLVLRAENTGSEPLVLERVVEGEALHWRPQPPARIGPGEHRFFDLDFSPGVAGPHVADLELFTDEEGQPPYRLETRAVALAPVPPAAEAAARPPLDLVLVLDVSTSMDGLAGLRDATGRVFDFAAQSGLDLRVGLTTFGNRVVVHQNGRFLDREAFTTELDTLLLDGAPNPDLPQHLLNFDFRENILDALFRSATRFEFRPEARRTFLLMTDDTFREPPEIFSDGTPATFSYRRVSEQLRGNEVRLFSVHDSRKGRGLSSSHRGQPSLVSATNGAWFELEGVRSGAPELGALLVELASGPACP